MSTLINKVLFTRAGYGLTVLRIFVGIIFAAHGSQKLFGAFGGYGLAGTAGSSGGTGPDLSVAGRHLLGAYPQRSVYG